MKVEQIEAALELTVFTRSNLLKNSFSKPYHTKMVDQSTVCVEEDRLETKNKQTGCLCGVRNEKFFTQTVLILEYATNQQ